MSAREYGKKYPGSGGARKYPIGGGADWYPLPEDTFYEVPITETQRPGFVGRVLHRPDTEVVVGYETRKRYH